MSNEKKVSELITQYTNQLKQINKLEGEVATVRKHNNIMRDILSINDELKLLKESGKDNPELRVRLFKLKRQGNYWVRKVDKIIENLDPELKAKLA